MVCYNPKFYHHPLAKVLVEWQFRLHTISSIVSIIRTYERTRPWFLAKVGSMTANNISTDCWVITRRSSCIRSSQLRWYQHYKSVLEYKVDCPDYSSSYWYIWSSLFYLILLEYIQGRQCLPRTVHDCWIQWWLLVSCSCRIGSSHFWYLSFHIVL